jgi:hypothetical protein
LFIDYLKGEVQYLCKSILLNAINNKIWYYLLPDLWSLMAS